VRVALVGTHRSVMDFARHHSLDPRAVERSRPQPDGVVYVPVLRPPDAMGQRFDEVHFLHGGSTEAYEAAQMAQVPR
jgi:hypothetical protein